LVLEDTTRNTSFDIENGNSLVYEDTGKKDVHSVEHQIVDNTGFHEAGLYEIEKEKTGEEEWTNENTSVKRLRDYEYPSESASVEDSLLTELSLTRPSTSSPMFEGGGVNQASDAAASTSELYGVSDVTDVGHGVTNMEVPK